jgi:hypothetical protein
MSYRIYDRWGNTYEVHGQMKIARKSRLVKTTSNPAFGALVAAHHNTAEWYRVDRSEADGVAIEKLRALETESNELEDQIEALKIRLAEIDAEQKQIFSNIELGATAEVVLPSISTSRALTDADTEATRKAHREAGAKIVCNTLSRLVRMS